MADNPRCQVLVKHAQAHNPRKIRECYAPCFPFAMPCWNDGSPMLYAVAQRATGARKRVRIYGHELHDTLSPSIGTLLRRAASSKHLHPTSAAVSLNRCCPPASCSRLAASGRLRRARPPPRSRSVGRCVARGAASHSSSSRVTRCRSS